MDLLRLPDEFLARLLLLSPLSSSLCLALTCRRLFHLPQRPQPSKVSLRTFLRAILVENEPERLEWLWRY